SGIVAGNRRIVWLDRSGRRVGEVAKPGEVRYATQSPDGKSVMFTIGDATAGNADLWLQNLETGVLSRLTFRPFANDRGVWSPDGRRIAFMTTPPPPQQQIALQPLSGTGRAEVLLPIAQTSIIVSDWSRDGRFILFNSRTDKTRDDVWALPLDGERKPVPLVQTPASETSAVFSPGGDWIASASNESRR